MLAFRMRQKSAEFYFASYPVEELLKKVHFVSRFYGEGGEVIGGEKPKKPPDEIEQFVAAIEGSNQAFQRDLNRRKVRQICDFFRNETEQPLVPGAVLLFTPEELAFRRQGGPHDQVGYLSEPQGKFLIIDGQHRLAGLHFYLSEPDAERHVEVPCVIFDGKTADFATEMFVIINSTHTRINKSHLVDLYERIEWGADEQKKYAAKLVRSLYERSDSPLQYHINMLGGRSTQDHWINQAQLFGEVHRLVRGKKKVLEFFQDGRGWSTERGYRFLRDVFRGARSAFGSAWGDNKRSMVTRDVTLKGFVRVAGDIAAAWGTEITPGQDNSYYMKENLAPWSELGNEFRREGFYERFAAKGQVERVDKIRRRLGKAVDIDV